MGDIAELWIWMLGIALAAFAPLGFFIYRFAMKANDPLGAHGAPHAPGSKLENVVNSILGVLLKRK